MALMATTSFAAEGRDEVALAEHEAIVRAIEARDGEAAMRRLQAHISKAFETRLQSRCGRVEVALGSRGPVCLSMGARSMEC